MEGVQSGKYLGLHQAAGVPCHHLGFHAGGHLAPKVTDDLFRFVPPPGAKAIDPAK